MVAAAAPGIVVIDGPSGAGKSELADRLVSVWPLDRVPVLIRMDNIYPGWHGLDAAGDHVGRHLVGPLAAGRTGRWRDFDWAADSLGAWHTVEAGMPIVLEGCGCLTVWNARHADLSVWLHADDEIRKARALARDKGGFDDYWDLWQRQFDEFVAREHPAERATLRLDGT